MEQKINIGIYGLDDNPDDLAAIERAIKKAILMLGRYPYELFEIGDDLINALKSNINLIILDHKLTGRDGLQLLKIIKQLYPSAYVIAFNAEPDRKVIIKYIRSKIDDWVDKLENDYEDILLDAITEGIRIANDRVEVYNFLKEEKRKIDRG